MVFCVVGEAMSKFWDNHARTIDPDNFRADGQFLGCQKEYPYRAMVEHVCDIGCRGWLIDMVEDGAFGCATEVIDGIMVSRDKLDSIVEFNFLMRCYGAVPLSRSRILDIGAGYGRLAHRMHEVMPHARICCADAVAVSSSMCARYLDFRGVPYVIAPPYDIRNEFDIAVNVHSWSECTRSEVVKWMKLLDEYAVQRLFVVPHDDSFKTDDGLEFRSAIEENGYVQREHWRTPGCWPRDLYLFEHVT